MQEATTVSFLIVEAESVVASETAQEILEARELFRELKIKVKEPIILWMDNQVAISQFLNVASPIKLENIDFRLKYVRHYMYKGIIESTYVHTTRMLVGLHKKVFRYRGFSN